MRGFVYGLLVGVFGTLILATVALGFDSYHSLGEEV